MSKPSFAVYYLVCPHGSKSDVVNTPDIRMMHKYACTNIKNYQF